MGRLRTGAVELGLTLEWSFAFIKPGSRVQAVPDGIFLDVGGEVASGILDQHKSESMARSSAALVRRFPAYVYDHLMTDWLSRARSGEELEGRSWKPRLITHEHPDFDSVVSMHLVRVLIETGDLPDYANALVEYVSEVDQGRYQVDFERPETATEPIHMAYLAIQNLTPPTEVACLHSWRAQRGERLLRDALAAITSARTELNRPPLQTGRDFYPGQPGVGLWRGLEEYADARELLDTDLDRYQHDRQNADKREVLLPQADDADSISVKAFILSEPPRSKLNKYWIRAEGYPYSIIPYGESSSQTSPGPGQASALYPTVILSLDPVWRGPNGERPTLNSLGQRLEEAEHRVRMNGGGDMRPLAPRYDDGSCTNGDPWYDGREHDHTIVAAPGEGTELAYASVCEIATTPFWRVPLASAEVVVIRRVENSSDLEWDDAQDVVSGDSLSSALSPLLRDCRRANLPKGWSPPFGAPEGFELERGDSTGVRAFPAETADPIEFWTFTAKQSGASLDELLAWIRVRRAEHNDALHICARVRLGPHFSSARAQAMLEEMTGDGRDQITRVEQDGEVLLFNSHSVVLHQVRPADRGPMDAPDEARLRVYRELMLYSVYLSEALRRFSTRIDDAIDDRGNVYGVRHVRADFLHFQIRYFHFEAATEPREQAVFARFSEALLLEKTYQEVQSELDRLDGAESRRSSSRIEVVLFILGLMVILEVVGALPTKDTWQIKPLELSWGWDLLRHKFVVALSSMSVVFALFLWMRRQSGERRNRRDEGSEDSRR